MPGTNVPSPRFQRILFAADFSKRSRDGFRVACSLARAESTHLIVLHVAELVHFADDDGNTYYDALKQRIREVYTPGFPLRMEYLCKEGEPAEEILRAATENACDLIVMGTHGHTGLGRLLVGSVAEAVLRKATCPVITARGPFPTSSDTETSINSMIQV